MPSLMSCGTIILSENWSVSLWDGPRISPCSDMETLKYFNFGCFQPFIKVYLFENISGRTMACGSLRELVTLSVTRSDFGLHTLSLEALRGRKRLFKGNLLLAPHCKHCTTCTQHTQYTYSKHFTNCRLQMHCRRSLMIAVHCTPNTTDTKASFKYLYYTHQSRHWILHTLYYTQHKLGLGLKLTGQS